MPLYRFLSTDGVHSIMHMDAVELHSVAAAKKHAVEIARTLVRNPAHAGEDWYGWQVRVIDADGQTVAIKPFSAHQALDPADEPYEGWSGDLRDVERFALMAVLLLGAVFAAGAACATAFIPVAIEPLARAAVVCGSAAAACLAISALNTFGLWEAI